MTTGTEFRDSIFTTTFYTPADVSSFGYNWFASSIGSLFNSSLLALVGVEKAQLLASDSARTFMVILDQRFGIRLGLITELWFAYSWYGLFIVFFIGAAMAYLSKVADAQVSDLRRAFLFTILANWAMAMMGQSSVLFGTLPTLLYAYVAVAALNKIVLPTTARVSS